MSNSLLCDILHGRGGLRIEVGESEQGHEQEMNKTTQTIITNQRIPRHDATNFDHKQHGVKTEVDRESHIGECLVLRRKETGRRESYAYVRGTKGG